MADSDSTKLWQFAGLGLEFATSLLVLGFVGWLIDTQAGTSPWGTLIGALLGLIAGLYLFIKRAQQALRQSRPADASGSSSASSRDTRP